MSLSGCLLANYEPIFRCCYDEAYNGWISSMVGGTTFHVEGCLSSHQNIADVVVGRQLLAVLDVRSQCRCHLDIETNPIRRSDFTPAAWATVWKMSK